MWFFFIPSLFSFCCASLVFFCSDKHCDQKHLGRKVYFSSQVTVHHWRKPKQDLDTETLEMLLLDLLSHLSPTCPVRQHPQWSGPSCISEQLGKWLTAMAQASLIWAFLHLRFLLVSHSRLTGEANCAIHCLVEEILTFFGCFSIVGLLFSCSSISF